MHKVHLNHALSNLHWLREQRLIIRLLVTASISAKSDINQLIYPPKSINKKSITDWKISQCDRFRFSSFVSVYQTKKFFKFTYNLMGCFYPLLDNPSPFHTYFTIIYVQRTLLCEAYFTVVLYEYQKIKIYCQTGGN